LIDSYYREKQYQLNELARKYRGEFTSQDYWNENWVRMTLLSFTEFFGLSKYSLSHDLSNALRGSFYRFSSAFLRNALVVNAPIMFAANTTNFNTASSYIEFILKSTLLSVLLFPI